VYRYARPGSLTGDAVGSTVLVEDMLRAADVIATYLPDFLPDDEAARVLDEARRLYGRWSLEGVPKLVADRRWRAAAASLRAGMTATSPLRMTGPLVEVVSQGLQRRLQRVGR
jgi:hypothetical protein